HINILTGNNNTGKTSILELLKTLKNPYSLANWLSVNRLGSIFDIERYYKYFNNLFPENFPDSTIHYEYKDENGNHNVNVKKNTVKELVSIEDVVRAYKIPVSALKRTSNLIDENNFESSTLNFKIQKDDDEIEVYSITNYQKSLKLSKTKDIINVRYISPVEHYSNINLKTVLKNNSLHDEMIEILKMFDENIVDILSVGSFNNTEYLIRTKNHTNALPLTFYGDGIKKVLLLVSAMMESKDGILLLDEFETAIHTSAMDTIFSWLLNNAVKMNVQVFLTSHSKEAINRVLRCDDSLSEKISYYTLFNYDDKNLIRKLSCSEAIKLQDQGGVDIR
ncbi:MAG: ATP-binding protein, partial [Oscillospiraceae bacterium]|nr:ATP-binding protein [Oscillospiraceae bacterium]